MEYLGYILGWLLMVPFLAPFLIFMWGAAILTIKDMLEELREGKNNERTDQW